MNGALRMQSFSDFLEKNRHVLWAVTPEGIVLHHFERSTFLELNKIQEFVWSHLDGIHGIEEIERKLIASGQISTLQLPIVRETVAMLEIGCYAIRREV